MNHKVNESRFWSLLWKHYPKAPSIVLCRVPELEYASTLDVKGRVLDHGCGDGLFASLAWPGRKLTAGCDISEPAITLAAKRGIYMRLDLSDASKKLPYGNQTFNLVFNNSALEHIMDLDAALLEVARVLSPHGIFAFSVLNPRYFEWWPLDEGSKIRYRQWQPFFHAFEAEEWKRRLARVGLQIISVEGYLDQGASRELARLDYAFSGFHLARRQSLLVWLYRCFPFLVRRYWQKRLAFLTWKTEPDAGAGYFIKAIRGDT